MAHGDAREGKWRGNWRMEWVASTFTLPRNMVHPALDCFWNVMAHAQKPDFVFRRNGRVHLNRRGASVQSTTGNRGVHISGSNVGYTMFRGSVKGRGYPLHSPVSPSHPLLRHHLPSRFNWTLLLLMRTPRLPVVDWTDTPTDLNGLVRFTERRNLVFARVPSHFKRGLPAPMHYFLSRRLKVSCNPFLCAGVWVRRGGFRVHNVVCFETTPFFVSDVICDHWV